MSFLWFSIILQTIVQVSQPCYVYPDGKKNPCQNVTCEYNAICTPAVDGSNLYRCLCRQFCYDYGDNEEGKPICGSDNRDYKNMCEFHKYVCENAIDNLGIKYIGKCGKCFISNSLFSHRRKWCKVKRIPRLVQKCGPIVQNECEGTTYSDLESWSPVQIITNDDYDQKFLGVFP